METNGEAPMPRAATGDLKSRSYRDVNAKRKKKHNRQNSYGPITTKTDVQTPLTDYNPAPHHQHKAFASNGDVYVIVMVGLPARGKTYISHKIRHYFEFFHSTPTRVFNSGQTRRKLIGPKQAHNFFDPENKTGFKLRTQMAEKTMENMIEWIGEYKKNRVLGRIAIYDASNTTRKRRKWIQEKLTPILQSHRHLIFVESICNDPAIIESNIKSVKLNMPDYQGFDANAAIQDFKKRIEHYEKIYEPLDNAYDDKMSWIKLVNGGDALTMNRIKGNLPGHLVTLLMNLHTLPREIYLSRHGKSLYNVQNRIGGDSGLSKRGEAYAKKLATYVEEIVLNGEESVANNASKARLYMSTMLRSRQTTSFIKHNVQKDGWVTMRPRRFAALDEIYAGKFDGMSPEEIKRVAPEESKMREKDKLNYRYPRGESYADAIERVQLVALQLERHRDPVLVVAHNGILRILYAYFMGLSREKVPHLQIPFNTVIKLTPRVYHCEENRELLLTKAEEEKYADVVDGSTEGKEDPKDKN